MIVPNGGRRAMAMMYGILALTVPVVSGQTPGAADKPAPAPSGTADKANETPTQRKLAFGIRARFLPARALSVMDNGLAMNTTTIAKVNYDTNYNTVSHSFMVGGGLALEVPLSSRTVVSIEALYNRLRYDKVTNVYWGVDDPNTAGDERSHKTTTENTKARLFDLPVLVHRNVRSSGFLSNLYYSGGATARLASTVHSTTNITNADATTANNSFPAQVHKRIVVGATIGVGFRFVDEFNIKVTPEVRFTRWNASTFSQDSTQSPRNQLEIGIAFTR